MKKTDEETSKEVVKKLVWRLKAMPTVDEVHALLTSELITKDEAREILFKVEQEEKVDPTSLQNLKKEIEFMRGMMLQIMNNGSAKTTIEYINRYPKNQFDWIRPYYMLANELPLGKSYGTGPITLTSINSTPLSIGVSNYVSNMGAQIKGVNTSGNGTFAVSSDPDARYLA